MFNLLQKVLNFIKNNKVFIAALLIGLTVRLTGLITINLVQGDSMYPTLNDGQILIGSSIYKLIDDIDYGDIITVRNGGVQIIKRVIGKEGDTIEIIDDHVYRNGEKINEEYVKTESPMVAKNIAPVTLKDDEYFILGDNREVSYDSRFIGPIPKDMIVSKIFK